MRIRNEQAPMPVPQPSPADSPARAAPRSRRYRLSLAVLLLVVGAACWGAWSLLRPDPLREVHAALDRRDFRTADELLTKHLERHPDDRAARMLAARSARRGGDLARAFDLLREYKQKYGSDKNHDLELALFRVQGGDIGEAERLFAEYSGRSDSPDMPFVMEAYLEGMLRVALPNPESRFESEAGETVLIRLDRAAGLWLAARHSNADQVQGLIWRGRVLHHARDLRGSVAAFRAALALEPDHYEARYLLAIVVSPEAPEELVQHLEILHNRRPRDPRLSYSLATAYRSLGRQADARRLLTEMLDADSRDVSALIELGLLTLDEGNIGEAEPLLQRALELAPNIPETNIAMSRCRQLAGRAEEAARYRKRFDEIEAERKKAKAGKP